MAKVLTIKDKFLLIPLWLMTLLPLRVLYFLADIIFFILYYVIKYRKRVVMDNLRRSFPKKDEAELKEISIKFFQYLADYFIESIYLINMSEKECNRRYKYKNVELLQRYAEDNRSIVLATSHFGNWDWAANLALFMPHRLLGVYKPLNNPVFNRLFIDLREKFGGISIPLLQTIRVLPKYIKNNNMFALYLVADQRPLEKDLDYWTTFLNQETPILTGMEKLAKRFDLPVIFFHLNRVKRGYYEVEFKLISDQPKQTESYEITEKYVRFVEQLIDEQPQYYLWSHKRWKYDPEKYNR